MLEGNGRTPPITKGFEHTARSEGARFQMFFKGRCIEREGFLKTKQNEVFKPHDSKDKAKTVIMAIVLLFVTQNPWFYVVCFVINNNQPLRFGL